MIARIAGIVLFAVALIASAGPVLAQPVSDPQPAATPPEPRSRPKIGLVLSGGGARGMTHVGVLQVLHRLRIPIDYVAATSMGAIVGGLYASGMSPDEMERQLEGVNWTTLLSDSPPRRDVGFRRKEELAAFPLSLEVGFRDGKFKTFKGALSGSNLELYLHELTRNVDNISDFDRLPIPFRAVATDMVSGKEVIFDKGRLYQVMRASMSVPGMFAPVEIDGQIFGDGGLVNNLPVDVVRRMGADIVIAVNIGTPLMTREQLSSVVGYASQMVNILTEQNVRAQLATLRPQDILISPDLGTLTFLDFTEAEKFIDLGVAAAEGVREKLAALAESPVRYAEYLRGLEAPPEAVPVAVDFVRVEGTRTANPKALEAQMATRPGEPFQLKTLESDLAHLYGSGDFESIDYRLVTEDRHKGVVINVTQKSWGPNFLRFGLSLGSDFQGDSTFNVLAGHRRVWVNSLGAEWSNEIILGKTRRYATEFYQPLSLGNFMFASAYGLAQRAPEYIFESESRVAEYDLLTETAGIDLGKPLGTVGEVRLGLKWVHYRGDPTVADPIYPTNKSTETGVRLMVRWDSLDHPYFARSGLHLLAEAFWGSRDLTIQGVKIDEDGDSSRLGIAANGAFNLSKHGFLNVAARAGAVNHERADALTDFNLGGFLQLSGLRTDQLSGNYVGFGRAVYYYQLGNVPIVGRMFAGGSLEAGNVWNTRSDVSTSGLIYAGSLFVAADTWLGPFYLAYGRASSNQSSFYLFLGRP